MSRYYSGIGSRETPSDMMGVMSTIAKFLAERGYTLRSGGAAGADTAFESGVPEGMPKEIYLPWKGFQDNPSKRYNVCQKALDLAERYHPVWSLLGRNAQRLMARNCYQVLGEDLKTPVDFIVCWTPGGSLRGGTAQAIRIAKDLHIPVYNLGKAKDLEFVKMCMDTDQIFVNKIK
jgi:hypothetical protein